MKEVSPIQAYKFTAVLDIIGINPFVSVPTRVLNKIFLQAGKDKGPVPVRGTVNDVAYTQTLLRYKGMWRLYINTKMLPNSPKRIGEKLTLTIAFDSADRSLSPHPKLMEALMKNKKAKKVFDALNPSLRKEIVRYISQLRTEKSVNANVVKAIKFLLGKSRFVGRDKPPTESF